MKIRKILLISGGLLAVAGSIWWWQKADQNIVTLTPSTQEFKKRPQDPGGITVPHSSSAIYDQLKPNNDRNTTYNIVPEPEEPLKIDYLRHGLDQSFNSLDEILENIGYFKTDDEKLSQYPATFESISPEVLMDQATIPQHQVEDRLFQDTKFKIIRASSNFRLKNLRNEHDLSHAGYKIQLGLAFSENDGQQEWENIKQKHSVILNGTSLVLRKVEGKNSRIFYLIMAGTYSSLSQAKLVCSKLSARCQNCMIVK